MKKINVSELSGSEEEAVGIVKNREFSQENTSLRIMRGRCSKRCEVLK
jgi:hypothetical protein